MDKFFPVTVVVFNNFSFLHIVCDGDGGAVDRGRGEKKKDIIYIIFALCHRRTVNAALNEIRVTGGDIKKIITIHTYI